MNMKKQLIFYSVWYDYDNEANYTQKNNYFFTQYDLATIMKQNEHKEQH